MIIQIVSSTIYESSSQGNTCLGMHCWKWSFVMMTSFQVIATFFGIFASFIIIKRDYKSLPQIKDQKLEMQEEKNEVQKTNLSINIL